MARLDVPLPPDDPRRSLISLRQMQSYFDTVPVAVMGNIFNACVIALFSWGSANHIFLLSWVAAVVIFSSLRVRTWRRFKNHPESFDAHATLNETAYIGLFLGSSWGICVAVVASALGPLQLVVLAIVGAGMMSGGASTFSLVPKAAVAFCGTVAIGSVIGIASVDHGTGMVAMALLACYCLVLHRSVMASFDSFISRTLNEQELFEQGETVKLLLNDYEEQGADWLWEVDLSGRLGGVTQRFAEAISRPAESIENTDLTELFEATPETGFLRDRIAAHESFRDVTLPLLVNGEPRWWMLSARVRHDLESGNVSGMRGVATDVTIAKRSEAKVAYMAHYDSLTDLPNRVLFNETLQRVLNRRTNAQQIAVLCLDLDQFKTVNDSLGHPVGDKLLQVIARRLEACVGELDLVSRQGGDEFSILLSNVRGPDEARKIAEKIIASVSDPIDIDGHRLLTATSVGIAIAPTDGLSVVDIVKNADLALYNAKANGRNRCSFFEQGMDESARKRREIEMDLRNALGNDELMLYYQPLVNIETGKTVGYEALMRWEHPTRGLVMPDDFIYIAEETGLIVQLGEWVIRNAANEAASWPDDLSISVNLSPAQMKSASLVSTVVNALAQSGLPAERMELEITENVLMQDSEASLLTLHKLRDIGLRISLDDFGTGYSSLNYLRSFPFSKIKIDRCFVDGIDTREDCRAIINSVVTLARKLGMTTTAEGVERSEQLTELGIEGCTEAQGYLFSKAMPVHELTDLRRAAPVLPDIPNIVLIPKSAPVSVTVAKELLARLQNSS